MGWGWEGECKKEERELGLDDFMLLKPQTTVKTTNVRFFSPTLNRRICVVIKYLMENYSPFLRQSMLNSTIFGEDSISLIALK